MVLEQQRFGYGQLSAIAVQSAGAGIKHNTFNVGIYNGFSVGSSEAPAFAVLPTFGTDVSGMLLANGHAGSGVTMTATSTALNENVMLEPKGAGLLIVENSLPNPAPAPPRVCGTPYTWTPRLPAFPSLIVDGSANTLTDGTGLTLQTSTRTPSALPGQHTAGGTALIVESTYAGGVPTDGTLQGEDLVLQPLGQDGELVVASTDTVSGLRAVPSLEVYGGLNTDSRGSGLLIATNGLFNQGATALIATGSGANESLSIDAKATGHITIGTTSTSTDSDAIVLGNHASSGQQTTVASYAGLIVDNAGGNSQLVVRSNQATALQIQASGTTVFQVNASSNQAGLVFANDAGSTSGSTAHTATLSTNVSGANFAIGAGGLHVVPRAPLTGSSGHAADVQLHAYDSGSTIFFRNVAGNIAYTCTLPPPALGLKIRAVQTTSGTPEIVNFMTTSGNIIGAINYVGNGAIAGPVHVTLDGGDAAGAVAGVAVAFVVVADVVNHGASGTLTNDDTAGYVIALGDARTTLTFTTTSIAGDWAEFVCDGTNWYVSGTSIGHGIIAS